jgi:hypothetical protein
MASRLSVDPEKLHATLKATVFQKASNEEMLALVVVANEYDLNPLLKEIYAFPAKGGGIVPIVSVDGWNKMLIRQKGFDGIEFDMVEGEDGKPICRAGCCAIARCARLRVSHSVSRVFMTPTKPRPLSTFLWKHRPSRSSSWLLHRKHPPRPTKKQPHPTTLPVSSPAPVSALTTSAHGLRTLVASLRHLA